jgi:tetratricopeptide (TPR) repeat protein
MSANRLKRLILSYLIVSGIVFALSFGNPDVHAQSRINDAPQIRDSQLTDRQAALREEIGELNRFITVHPRNVTAYEMRATRYAELKDYPAAIADYSRLIALEPAELRHRLERASYYQAFAHYDKALADLDHVLKRAPRSSNMTGYEAYSALYARSLIYWKLKAHVKAAADLTEILKFRPTDESIYQSRSELYKQTKQYPEAIADYTRLIEINPRSMWSYLGRAEVYRKLGEPRKAEADIKAADLIIKNRNN